MPPRQIPMTPGCEWSFISRGLPSCPLCRPSGWKKPPRRFLLDEETMRREIAAYRRLQFDRVASFACYLGEDYEALYGDGIDVAPFADATKQA